MQTLRDARRVYHSATMRPEAVREGKRRMIEAVQRKLGEKSAANGRGHRELQGGKNGAET